MSQNRKVIDVAHAWVTAADLFHERRLVSELRLVPASLTGRALVDLPKEKLGFAPRQRARAFNLLCASLPGCAARYAWPWGTFWTRAQMLSPMPRGHPFREWAEFAPPRVVP